RSALDPRGLDGAVRVFDCEVALDLDRLDQAEARLDEDGPSELRERDVAVLRGDPRAFGHARDPNRAEGAVDLGRTRDVGERDRRVGIVDGGVAGDAFDLDLPEG